MKARHIYRVTWSRDRWTASRGGGYKYYSRRSDAEKFINKITDPNNTYNDPVDSWRLEHSPVYWTVLDGSER